MCSAQFNELWQSMPVKPNSTPVKLLQLMEASSQLKCLPGHLVNHKELGKTEPTRLEDKSAPTFCFLKCEGGDFSVVQGACEMVI